MNLKWAVFISGNGSNLQALLDAQPPISIVTVVSSKADAFGVQRAQKAGISVQVLPKDIQWEELSFNLKSLGVDRIFLAGFMRLVPSSFVEQWSHKILNLHPSLLPAYKGLKAIERSYHEGAAMGITIHWVTADLDAGPILLQEVVYPAGEAQKWPIDLVNEKIHLRENHLVVEAVRKVESC